MNRYSTVNEHEHDNVPFIGRTNVRIAKKIIPHNYQPVHETYDKIVTHVEGPLRCVTTQKKNSKILNKY
jgi:hypothetical protein